VTTPHLLADRQALCCQRVTAGRLLARVCRVTRLVPAS